MTTAAAETAAKGGRVHCKATGAPSDRTVLLYPGRAIPGAAEAEAAIAGVGVGGSADTSYLQPAVCEYMCSAGGVTYTVERAVARQAESLQGMDPAEIDSDELPANQYSVEAWNILSNRAAGILEGK